MEFNLKSDIIKVISKNFNSFEDLAETNLRLVESIKKENPAQMFFSKRFQEEFFTSIILSEKNKISENSKRFKRNPENKVKVENIRDILDLKFFDSEKQKSSEINQRSKKFKAIGNALEGLNSKSNMNNKKNFTSKNSESIGKISTNFEDEEDQPRKKNNKSSVQYG